MASLHELVAGMKTQRPDHIWKLIWGWKGPQRIKCFLWLCAHERLLTKKEKVRRHIANDSVCPLFREREELTLHAIRYCKEAGAIWKEVLDPKQRWSFFSTPLHNWLWPNLRGSYNGVNQEEWRMTFGYVCWSLWKWMNCRVFEGSSLTTSNKVDIVRNSVTVCREAMKKLGSIRVTNHQETEVTIGWTSPPEGWVCLNTNGARPRLGGWLGAGGVIRNSKGEWVGDSLQTWGK